MITSVNVRRRNVSTCYHPCTVMEYEDDDIAHYDFVYFTMYRGGSEESSELQYLFRKYSKDNGKGSYLFQPDMVMHLCETEYNSPQDLQKLSPGGFSYLSLLQERIKKNIFNDKTLEQVYEDLVTYCDSSEKILKLSRQMSGGYSRWHVNEAIPRTIASLLDYCMKHDKVDSLVDAMRAFEYVPHFRLSRSKKNEIVSVLLQLPCLDSDTNLRFVIQQLPLRIRSNIEQWMSLEVGVHNMLDACLVSVESFSYLMQVLSYLSRHARALERVEAVMQECGLTWNASYRYNIS